MFLPKYYISAVCVISHLWILTMSHGQAEETEVGSLRSKRQTVTTNNIQLYVISDYAVYKWFYDLTDLITIAPEDVERDVENRITQYYTFVVERTSERFEAIPDPKIRIELAGLDIIKTPEGSPWTESRRTRAPQTSERDFVESTDVLDDLLYWVNTTSLPQYDHIVLFTGYNLRYEGSPRYTGLTFAESVCTISAISVVQDSYDVRTVGTTAQEIGRSLGARLDLDLNNCLSGDLNIMTQRFYFPEDAETASNLWRFSTCSIDYFKASLSSLQASCLTDSFGQQFPPFLQRYLTSLPGEIYSADMQCEMVNGRGSYVCREDILDYKVTSRGLSCHVPKDNSCALILPWDGTPCGNKSYSVRGVCTRSETARVAQDNCMFGDVPISDVGPSCRVLVDTTMAVCYNTTINRRCCASCREKATSFPDCKFGDRIDTCAVQECHIYSNETRNIDCCLTCKGVSIPTAFSGNISEVTEPLTTTVDIKPTTQTSQNNTEQSTIEVSMTSSLPTDTQSLSTLPANSNSTEQQSLTTVQADLNSTDIKTEQPPSVTTDMQSTLKGQSEALDANATTKYPQRTTSLDSHVTTDTSANATSYITLNTGTLEQSLATGATDHITTASPPITESDKPINETIDHTLTLSTYSSTSSLTASPSGVEPSSQPLSPFTIPQSNITTDYLHNISKSHTIQTSGGLTETSTFSPLTSHTSRTVSLSSKSTIDPSTSSSKRASSLLSSLKLAPSVSPSPSTSRAGPPHKVTDITSTASLPATSSPDSRWRWSWSASIEDSRSSNEHMGYGCDCSKLQRIIRGQTRYIRKTKRDLAELKKNYQRIFQTLSMKYKQIVSQLQKRIRLMKNRRRLY